MNIPVSAASVNNNHSITLEVLPSLPPYQGPEHLAYYAEHACALFPMPRGSKEPWGIINSFAHDWSRDPAQWAKWYDEHKCNFGIVAGPSRKIIADIDVAEVGIEVAWKYWGEWCQANNLPVYTPQFNSARGGWHVAFQMRDDLDIKTLRQVPLIGAIEGVSKKAIVDLRVGNGFVVAAGSYYDGTAKGQQSGHYQLRPDAAAPYPLPQAIIDHCEVKRRKAAGDGIGDFDYTDMHDRCRYLAEQDGFLRDEFNWVKAIWALRRAFGDRAWPLVEIISYCDARSRRESVWEREDANKENPATCATLIHESNAAGYREWKNEHMWDGVAAHVAAGQANNDNTNKAPPLPPGTPMPQTATDVAAAQAEADDAAYELEIPTPPGGFYQSESEFTAGFVPPNYLVDTILQRGFLYGFTARTGAGKTAIGMLLAALTATGEKLGNLEVEKGKVVYWAGENPDDIRMRWIGLKADMGLLDKKVDVYFMPGANPFDKITKRIFAETAAIGPSLVIVDTLSAYYDREDEIDNVDMARFARRLRKLCELPSRPTVIILCHPTKAAKTLEEMLPRGGGGFLNELDGNLAATRSEGGPIALHWAGKFRGPDFVPLRFDTATIRHPILTNAKGVQMPTVVARAISAGEAERREEHASKEEDKVLKVLCDNAIPMKKADIAKATGWTFNKTKRALERLKGEGLAAETKDYWSATPKGQKYLNAVATAQPAEAYTPLTPANLGPVSYPTPRMVAPPPMPPQ